VTSLGTINFDFISFFARNFPTFMLAGPKHSEFERLQQSGHRLKAGNQRISRMKGKRFVVQFHTEIEICALFLMANVAFRGSPAF